MIEMDETGPTITEADIERVEANLGVRFPDDYRTFLLQYNGGSPHPWNSAFPPRRGPGSTVRTFYGINPPRDHINVEYRTLRYWNEKDYPLPRTLILIGDDSFGDWLCLGVAGDELNKVFFRDMERLPEKPPTKPWAMMKGYYKVADSFTEFLSLLGPVDQDPS